MWKFNVRNQSIEIVEREVLADHQISYVQFRFTFDGDWKRFHKVVQFSQCDEVYSIVLGVEGTSCYLPSELHVGAAKMSLFGYDTASDTTVRATTVPVTLNIRASGFEGDDPPVPPTTDLYVQLLKKIEEASHGGSGKSAYEIAVEHGFIGTEEQWLLSLRGADGQNGIDGKDGLNGLDGKDGQNGRDGIDGKDGLNGKDGRDGVDGKDGKDGIDGKDGSTVDLSGYATTEALNEQILLVREAMASLEHAKHTHANKDVLDDITESHVGRWNEAYANAINLNERIGVDEGKFEQFKTNISHDVQLNISAITEIYARLKTVEQSLSGVEDALAAIVEVSE